MANARHVLARIFVYLLCVRDLERTHLPLNASSFPNHALSGTSDAISSALELSCRAVAPDMEFQ